MKIELVTEEQIKPFAALLQADQLRGLIRHGVDCEPNRLRCVTRIKMGKKYAKVDIGGSGRYMVEIESGAIFGIKAYGVIHRGHQYGTLDTIANFDWSGYGGAIIKASFGAALQSVIDESLEGQAVS